MSYTDSHLLICLRRSTTFLILPALFFSGLKASAQPATPRPSVGAPMSQVTLLDAIQQMTGEAPQLRALETQTELAEKDRWRRFLPNAPMFSYEKDESDSSQTYGVSMAFGFPGKAFAYAELDKALVKKQKFEQAAKRHELISLVTKSYIDCAAAQETIRIRERSLADLEAFLQSLKARRGVTQTEKLSFEIETRQARQELINARDEKDVNCKKLDTYLGEKGATPALTLPEDLDQATLSSLTPMTADESRAEATIGVADATYSTAGWSQMPEFALGISRKQMMAPEIDARAWSNVYSISMTIPIFYPFQESVEIQRTRSQATLDKSEAVTQKIQLDSDREEAAKTFVRSRNHLREIRARDLSLGQALLESSISAYRGGQIGYAEMVLARKTLIDLRIKDVELRSSILEARLQCLNRCEVTP